MSYKVNCLCPTCNEMRTIIHSQNKPQIRRCRKCGKPKTIGKKIKSKNGYILIQTHDGFTYEHRHVWERKFGAIPKDYVIHHKDGDKTNNNLENLEIMHRRKHDSIGSTEQWEKRYKGELPPLCKPNQKDFKKEIILEKLMNNFSVNEISKEFNISHSTLRRNLRDYNIILKFEKDAMGSPKENVIIYTEEDNETGIITIYKTLKPYLLQEKQRKKELREKYTDAKFQKENLLKLINMGKSVRQIARELGVSHTMIENRLKRD